MSPRTATPAPTDRSMWRRLLMRAHPDQGGDASLFVWARELEEKIQGAGGTSVEACGECCQLRQEQRNPGPAQPPPPGHSEATDRIVFDSDSRATDHEVLVERAVSMAASGEVGEPYARLLVLLKYCASAPEHRGAERVGATFKQLALVAHRAGMSKAERVGWYEVAQAVPLSGRLAGYLIEQVSEGAA